MFFIFLGFFCFGFGCSEFHCYAWIFSSYGEGGYSLVAVYGLIVEASLFPSTGSRHEGISSRSTRAQ